jgi:hypothetical protein
LSIDCDEMPDETLVQTLRDIDLTDANTVYKINFRTFLGKKLIRYGEWGKDAHIRLFNRTSVRWNNAAVHEQLIMPDGVRVKNCSGFILHYTMKDVADYATKITHYALLNAERYFRQGKKAGFFKRRISPGFSFFQNYLIRLGFLDGHEGYLIASMTRYYTFLKYHRLYELTHSTGA